MNIIRVEQTLKCIFEQRREQCGLAVRRHVRQDGGLHDRRRAHSCPGEACSA
jgi:hypothetical protein